MEMLPSRYVIASSVNRALPLGRLAPTEDRFTSVTSEIVRPALGRIRSY